MNLSLKPKYLNFLILGASAAAFALRKTLYAFGFDGRGLLVENHPAALALWGLTAVVAVLLILFALRPQGGAVTIAPRLGAAGAFAAAAGVLINAMAELARREVPMAPLVGLLGIAAAAALAFTGLCRLKGLRPTFLFHTLICLNFVVRLISHYQIWCADPQLQDYCFQLLGTVCAMLFAYHRAALDMKGGNRRTLVIMGLLGSYCCCLSVVASDAPTLYAGLAAWMITNLGTLASATEESAEGN